ncbi:uncharacterized protein LOC116847945 [Odontomachus brunneus]|uniref:uncharacterized protein LOC116847945 n=1 Tax=Odontomachus brunneus TaxID=486640 RepID=UPI0013F1DD0F|nr:uncharacterized protein LOC116847945 [Odontomachus brunneus]XP_032679459.1 uncharacterized protein LOC116847945 [Odontomachus brunneus]XP_032679460.1 uncharacterized protein LOC116847945 [Odontomachus brunneus]XP_032679461.1 uncharacterized protein LOC116847945 [Odontomachus brunneus]
MWQCLWIFFVVLICVSGEYLMGGHLDNNAGAKSRSEKIDNFFALEHKGHVDDLDPDLIAEESTVATVAVGTASSASIDNDVPRYHIPYPFAFNGGKPFSLEKDPITGKIDFEKAPPVRALNYTSRYHEHENKENVNVSEKIYGEENTYAEHRKTKGNDNDDVSPNEINTYTVNFHDFLNLPINYSSAKYGNDKYPLISNSYANTKVQSGTNSYSTYNHRPYHIESDSYILATRNPYVSIMNTSAHNATTVSDFKTKLSTVAFSIKTSTAKAPIVTTWKPFTTPIVFDSINRITPEEENEENILSREQLQISSHVEAYKSPSNMSTQSLNDETTEKTQTVIRYKNQPTRNNFAPSRAKPSTQHEEYKDSYDVYESPDDEGESEDESEDGDEDEVNSDNGSDDDDNRESDLLFQDLSKKHVTQSTLSITIANAMTSTASTTANAVTTKLSEGTTSAVTTVAPSGSSTQRMLLQQDLFASDSLQSSIMSQHPAASSSLINNLGHSITERYDPNTSHEYKSTVKSVQDRVGAGIVIESTSNIVIPPDQDTVSFVLGNRQNVEGGYYSVGTAIGENPYGSLSDIETSFWPLRNNPHGSTKEIKYEQPPASVAEPSPDRVIQKWWPPGSSVLKNYNQLEPPRSQSSFAAASIATIDTNRDRSQEKDANHFTLSDVETKNKETITEERIAVVNEADNNMRELPPKVTLTTTAINKTKINLPVANASGDLPQLAENLMPPAESTGPPPYYQYQYDTTLRTDHTRPQRLPLSPRIKPHSGFSGSPLDVGSRRRPYSPEAKLPNILPQFRPNTKASYGHRFGSDVIGTMPAGQSLSTRIKQPLQNHPASRRQPFPPPPSYLQRLNPPPPPIHAVRLAFVPTSKMDNAASLHEIEPTIRKFRPPSIVSSISRGSTEENTLPFNKSFDHTTDQDDNESKTRDQGKSEIVDERENESLESYPEEPPITPPKPPLFPKRRTADPLHVTTLQMIQHHGEFTNNDENEARLTQHIEPVLAHQAERRKSDNHDLLEIVEQPVYVVYPVNTAVNIHSGNSKEEEEEKVDDNDDDDGSVVVGTRGPHRPLPPDTLLQDEREKIHKVYNGRPAPVASDFPYPLEHSDLTSMFPGGTKETPLLVPSEQRQQTAPVIAADRKNEKNEQDATNVIPYLQDFLPFQKKNDATISVTLHRTAPILTSASTTTTPTSLSTSTPTPTPIAYVYTPTHAAAYPTRHFNDDDKDAATNIDATTTVLLPSQQPSSSSNSAPMPQNFMAPFVASISAETPSKNGWSVVVVEPPAEADKKLDNDNDDAKLASSEMDTQTEKNDFDVDNFKPQLFGGFKPIYEFPTEDMERRDDTNFETDISRHPKKLAVPDER